MTNAMRIDAEVPPVRMEAHERSKIRAAAFRIKRVYPGAVGELLARELLTWEEFGFRLGGSSLIMQVADYALKAPLPVPTLPQ